MYVVMHTSNYILQIQLQSPIQGRTPHFNMSLGKKVRKTLLEKQLALD